MQRDTQELLEAGYRRVICKVSLSLIVLPFADYAFSLPVAGTGGYMGQDTGTW